MPVKRKYGGPSMTLEQAQRELTREAEIEEKEEHLSITIFCYVCCETKVHLALTFFLM